MVATTVAAQRPLPLSSDLILRLKRRDASAFDALVRDNSRQLHSVAMRMLHREEDAADVVQEAFVAALKSIDRFRGDANVSTWLHRIVVNNCLMKLRRRRATTSDAMGDLLPAPTADDALVAEETRANVRRCIESLPVAYRTVLTLRDVDERDTHETAALLRMSPGAVKTRLHRARRALRLLLEQSMPGECLATGV